VLGNIGITKVQAGESTTTMSLYEFNALTDKTNYLRVKSFRAEYYAELDSFYKKIHEAVISKPFLVIDVRGNGGGAESNYFPLLKYLYTNPIYPDVFQFYATPDIIKRHQESLAVMRADSIRYGKNMIQSTEEIIRQLQAAKMNSFLPPAKQTPITLTTVLPFPRKVILLTDRGCASSCEAFIYNASQSKKVETMGENTGGFVGFGNTQNFKTPCYGYNFQSTTTKYTNLYKYEFTGIPPKVKLQRDIDWIQAAVNRLEKGQF
jgi:C-terminal processing protease CtpA/Prc